MFKKQPRIYPEMNEMISVSKEIQLYYYEAEYYILNLESVMKLVSHYLTYLSENLFIRADQPFLYVINDSSAFYQLSKHNYTLKIYVEKRSTSAFAKIEIVKSPKYKYRFMLETESHLIDRMKDTCRILQQAFEELEESEVYMEGRGNVVLKSYGLYRINELEC